ncbi:hypothetical protein J6590_045055 [Homalodisca vitripennis]|nr:hypothetical protein J6590_045055 [Homalodisca vitripennis]
MNRNSIEDNQVLEELLRCSSDSESDDLFQDDTDNDPDFTTDGLLGDAILNDAARVQTCSTQRPMSVLTAQQVTPRSLST